MARFLFLVLALVVPELAAAQAVRDVRIRFELPANAAEAQLEGFRLYRTPTGGPEEVVDVGTVETLEDGTSSAVVGFLRARAYTLQLTAFGPAGESDRSNAITLPAVPDAPGALEVVLEVRGRSVSVREVREIP
jgi:hypothetical protein